VQKLVKTGGVPVRAVLGGGAAVAGAIKGAQSVVRGNPET